MIRIRDVGLIVAIIIIRRLEFFGIRKPRHLHNLDILVHVNGILPPPLRQAIKVDALSVDAHVRIGILLRLHPVHGDEVDITGALQRLHEHVDAVVDVYVPHTLHLFQMHSLDIVEVVVSVGNLPKEVEAVQVMVGVKDGGVGVVAETPVCVFELGCGGGVFAHGEDIGGGDGDDAGELPFLPDGVGGWVGLLASDGWVVGRGEEGAVYSGGRHLEVEAVMNWA